jgi:serine protease Do
LLPGARIQVEIIRDQQRIVLDVALIERRDRTVTASLPQTRPEAKEVKLGIEVQALTPGLADQFKLQDNRGVLITKVDPGGIAQNEGLQEGDLIKEVNRVAVGSVEEFNGAISKVRPGETVLFRVLRESRAFFVVLKSNGS